MGLPRETLVPLALVCNLVVSAQGTYSYRKAGFFRPQLFWPLALSSVPFAFLGGLTPISDTTFYLLLGVSLLLAAVRMFVYQPKGTRYLLQQSHKRYLVPFGALLGYLAGLIGLGGGIFLAPLLILSGTTDAKQTAAVTAPFILVNSLSGLAAHANHLTPSLFSQSIPLILAVGVGGWLGSRLGAYRLQPIWVQRTGAVLLSLVSFKILGRIPL